MSWCKEYLHVHVWHPVFPFIYKNHCQVKKKKKKKINLLMVLRSFLLFTFRRTGTSLTLMTRRDWRWAGDIIKIMEEAGQASVNQSYYGYQGQIQVVVVFLVRWGTIIFSWQAVLTSWQNKLTSKKKKKGFISFCWGGGGGTTIHKHINDHQ